MSFNWSIKVYRDDNTWTLTQQEVQLSVYVPGGALLTTVTDPGSGTFLFAPLAGWPERVQFVFSMPMQSGNPTVLTVDGIGTKFPRTQVMDLVLPGVAT